MRTGQIRRSGVLCVLFAASALASSGCLAVAAGAAGTAAVGYAYCRGKVGRHYPANFDDVWAATHSSLAELGLPVLSEERESANSGSVVSKTGDDAKVRIYLETEANRLPGVGSTTVVAIRVATFGDQAVSERILDQISYHLVPGSANQALTPQTPTLGMPQALPGFPPQTAPPPLLPPESAKP
jgi:hypothetical protein